VVGIVNWGTSPHPVWSRRLGWEQGCFTRLLLALEDGMDICEIKKAAKRQGKKGGQLGSFSIKNKEIE